MLVVESILVPDPNPILLLHSLRVTLDSLNRLPELDQRYCSIQKLRNALQNEIEELKPEVELAVQHMPEPSVGVPA